MKFSKGYGESREKVKKAVKFMRSCFNCEYYYKTISDKEEVCQNSNVTQFDLVVEDNNNAYCCYWKQSGRKSDNSLFKGGIGRNRVI